jgi:hypothetical protein
MKTTQIRSLAAYIAAACALSMGTTSLSASAALIAYDGFDYTGTALETQNGGTGWTDGWFNTGSTDNQLSDDGTSLAFPGPFEAPLSTPATVGSHVKTGGVNASSSRLMSQTIPLNVDGATAYVSAMFRKNRPNGAGNSDNILLEFVDASANRRWGFGIEGTGDKPWLNANGSTTPSSGTAVTVGDT